MGMISSKKVFVSSTTKDLSQYRKEAVEVITNVSNHYKNKFQLVEVTMDTEMLDGERKSAVERSRGWVADCDWFVLIVAWHYGLIQQNEEISVTEWEYKQAVLGNKTCFIFLAGEKNDGDKKYFPIKGRDKENLSDWKEDEEPDCHKNELERFKTELRSTGDIRIFSDIDNFLEQLDGALKNRIDLELKKGENDISLNKLSETAYDNQLLLILHELISQMQGCIDEIKLLANLKQVHLLIHQVRQFGIRCWREQVSSLWSEGMELSVDAKNIYLEGLVQVNTSRMKLVGFLQQIPDQADVVKSEINKMLATEFKIKPDRKDEFEKITDLYARRVQRAFTEANLAMVNRANLLSSCQLSNFPKSGMKLRENDQFSLDTKVNALNKKQNDLKSVFIQHNEWQSMHDQLELIDNTKGTTSFQYELASFIDGKQKIINLLEHAAQLATISYSPGDWQSTIDAVKRKLEALDNQLAIDDDDSNEMLRKALVHYERMRKAFDDLFYLVDVEMLKTVEDAEDCAQRSFSDLKALVIVVMDRISNSQNR